MCHTKKLLPYLNGVKESIYLQIFLIFFKLNGKCKCFPPPARPYLLVTLLFREVKLCHRSFRGDSFQLSVCLLKCLTMSHTNSLVSESLLSTDEQFTIRGSEKKASMMKSFTIFFYWFWKICNRHFAPKFSLIWHNLFKMQETKCQ